MNSSRAPKRNRSNAALLVSAIALAMLLPITITPFLGDDTFNSYINGAIGYNHQSFWGFIRDLNAGWIRNGRFFPGALVESYGLFHIMPSLAAYKFFQLLITLANIATFFVLLRELRLPRTLSLFGTLVLVVSFQMRAYHDGLLGFSGNIEFIMEIAMLSLLGLLLYLRSKNPQYLAASLAIYAIGLLTYEVTYLLWLAFFAVLLVECPWRKAMRLLIPYVSLSAIVIAIQLYVKANAHAQTDPDYNVSLNIASLLATFLKQWLAAIPLTYVAIDPSSLFAHGASVFSTVPIWIITAIFLVVATVTWMLTASFAEERVEDRTICMIAAIGCILWITPALLVASSARYQRELVFGLGHVPVYIEYFGVTMILLALTAFAITKGATPSRPMRLAMGVVLGLVAMTTYASNAVVIARSLDDKAGLENIEAAVHSGLLRDVPGGSQLYVDGSIAPNRYLNESATDAKYFYFYETGTRYDVHSIGALPTVNRCAAECKLREHPFELINVPNGDAAGFAAIGRVSAIGTFRGQVRSFAADVKLFVRGIPSGHSLWVRYVEHGCGTDQTITQIIDPRGPSSAIMRIHDACGLVEMNKLAVSELPTRRYPVRMLNRAAVRVRTSFVE